MSLSCRLGSHVAQARPIWNDGICFSTCTRCGCALVRRASSTWERPPSGYRVVWKPRPPDRRRIDPFRELPRQGYFKFR
jgi:hypothetical protein